MKKILLVLVTILGPAVISSAQETYSFSANATQVNRVDRGRLTTNAKACVRAGQSVTCTQAQACTPPALNCTNGASCTAAQARACGQRIYPATQAGREEFLGFGIIVVGLSDLQNLAVAYDQTEFCRLFKITSGANQNTVCTTIGYTPVSGQCEVCP